MNLYFVNINEDYLDFLRRYDNKISYTKNEKQRRKFVGVLLKINDMSYFAPLTSKQRKTNTTNFTIKDKDNKSIGMILFNNMIPVSDRSIIKYNINKETDNKYKKYAQKELIYINDNKNIILKRAMKTYQGKIPKVLKDNCLNFKLLEEKCKKYEEIQRNKPYEIEGYEATNNTNVLK